MMHLLDANAFIEASRFYYAFDLAPGYWHWLEDPTLAGAVASIQAVKDEITAGDDALVEWAKRMPDAFWLSDTAESIGAMRDAVTWATAPDRLFTQPLLTSSWIPPTCDWWPKRLPSEPPSSPGKRRTPIARGE